MQRRIACAAFLSKLLLLPSAQSEWHRSGFTATKALKRGMPTLGTVKYLWLTAPQTHFRFRSSFSRICCRSAAAYAAFFSAGEG